MERLLVITLLDYRTKPNNRIQHTVRALQDRFDEVWLLCRRSPASGGLRAKIRNVLPFSSRAFRDGNVQILEYDPPLNYHGHYRAVGEDVRACGRLSALVNLAGLVREILFYGAILYVALRRLRGRFDLCVVETSWEGIVALLLRRLGRVSRIVFDDNDFNPSFMRSRIRMRYTLLMERACVRRADLAISTGHLLADYWRQETGREVVVIPNGVDVRSFDGTVGREGGRRNRLAYVGTLSTSWVDLDLVLDAMRSLREAGVHLDLTVVGAAGRDYLGRMRARIRRDGMENVVRWTGAVPHEELPAILGRCDIGLAVAPVNLLRRFAFPLKVVEYMATGLPVVGNRDTETGWLIEHYAVGVAIRPVEEELNTALRRLVADRAFYERCRRHGLAGARDFDLERIAAVRREIMVDRFRGTGVWGGRFPGGTEGASNGG